MSEERLTRIEEKVEALQVEMRAGFHDVRADVQDLRTGQKDLRAGQEDLARQMRVLYEQTLDNIKALAPDLAPLRRDFEKADADLREGINRRLDPLEAWARDRRS